MKSIYSIIKEPLITEKTTRLGVMRKYVFSVAIDANKIEIKRAIENLYKVKAVKISTMTLKGKTKKLKWNQPGKTSSWKKAVVTLKEGQEIKIT
ncbi:MAG: 50S ribosomal protein L23 [Candidatus Omnitrophota bacterium]